MTTTPTPSAQAFQLAVASGELRHIRCGHSPFGCVETVATATHGICCRAARTATFTCGECGEHTQTCLACLLEASRYGYWVCPACEVENHGEDGWSEDDMTWAYEVQE